METAEAATPAASQTLQPLYLVIHHTGILSSEHPKQLEIVNGSHRRKWGNTSTITGYDVEYHYFIGKNGRIVQTRDDSERTGHTRCAEEGTPCKNGHTEINDNSISIVLAGNFDIETLEDPQLSTARHTIRMLMARYDIPKDRVIGHQEASATSCPGKHVMELLTRP